MKKYWQIIPVGDGYTYIGFENGEHVLRSKNSDAKNKTLIFKTKKDCVKYIKENLDTQKYAAEDFMMRAEYYGIKV